jgi:hypothetical protein
VIVVPDEVGVDRARRLLRRDERAAVGRERDLGGRGRPDAERLRRPGDRRERAVVDREARDVPGARASRTWRIRPSIATQIGLAPPDGTVAARSRQPGRTVNSETELLLALTDAS